jgi:ABC-type transport system involved in multi-copper enzyme maturation permease subunit
VNRVLVGKELRELRPYLVLGLVLTGYDLLDDLLRHPDLVPMGWSFSQLADSFSAVLALLAVAVGTGLQTRERDEGTLVFLDGLPLSRTRLFLIKLLTALAVLMVYPVGRAALTVGMHLLSRGSLDHAVHLELVLSLLSMQLLVVLSSLLFGATVGLLRSLAWLSVGVTLAGLLVIEKTSPRLAALNPYSLIANNFHNGTWVLNRQAIGVQLGCVGLFGLLAWLGFRGDGGQWLVGLARRPAVSAIIGALTLVAFVIFLVLSSSNNGKNDSGSQGPIFRESPPAEVHTQHFNFSYPAFRSEEALALANQADEVFVEVHHLLGVAQGAPIQVDLSGSMRNTSGTAYLGHIRMELKDNARQILAHECSHVISQRLAGESRAVLWLRAPVLNEGMATWVESHFASEGSKPDYRLVLATLHARHQLKLEDFTDSQRFPKIVDDNLKYAVGLAVMDAMVRVYGPEAPGKLVRAFATPELPQDVDKLPLWQATFQLANMDLGRVSDEMFRDIDEQSHRLQKEIAALPRPRAMLVTDGDGRVGVRVELDRPLPRGWRQLVRFRPNADSPISRYDTQKVPHDGHPIWREPFQVERHRVCLQPGIESSNDLVLYEPWSCLEQDDAEPWSPPAPDGGA